jgi:carbamoyltransferase
VPTRILGVSAYYHDSAACLVEDGRIVAAAQEERFTRKKHDAGFPTHAVEYCLTEAGIGVGSVDLVGFYEKPLLKFDRLLETYAACAPRGWKSYLMATTSARISRASTAKRCSASITSRTPHPRSIRRRSNRRRS